MPTRPGHGSGPTVASPKGAIALAVEVNGRKRGGAAFMAKAVHVVDLAKFALPRPVGNAIARAPTDARTASKSRLTSKTTHS
jgi:hypothetical protein